ncbi:MAG: 1-acyl-sn-glycerol-3-phosphate acyltransferase, partial [Bdellovibrionota bacterium]
PAQNKETFEAAKRILRGGGTIALFPEGISHSESKLKPLKTGAARIALGASPLKIVPAGLYYTAKGAFRSSAVLVFSDPFEVPKYDLGPTEDPAPEAVHALTSKIDQSLKDLIIQADQSESLTLVSRAERIFRSAEANHPSEKNNPVGEFELKRLLLAGYTTLRARFPEKLEEIKSLIDQYEASLQEAGIDPFHLRPHRFDPIGFLIGLFKALGYILLAGLFFPFVLCGLILHFPAYRLVGVLSVRYAKEDQDMISTVKMLAAMLLFPLTWLIAAIALGRTMGLNWFFSSFLIFPFSGICALLFLEKLNEILGRTKTFGLFFSNPKSFQMLLEERERIRKTILSLEQLLNQTQG